MDNSPVKAAGMTFDVWRECNLAHDPLLDPIKAADQLASWPSGGGFRPSWDTISVQGNMLILCAPSRGECFVYQLAQMYDWGFEKSG